MNPICNSYGTGTMASTVPTTIVYYINACRRSHSYRAVTKPSNKQLLLDVPFSAYFAPEKYPKNGSGKKTLAEPLVCPGWTDGHRSLVTVRGPDACLQGRHHFAYCYVLRPLPGRILLVLDFIKNFVGKAPLAFSNFQSTFFFFFLFVPSFNFILPYRDPWPFT